MLLSQHQKTIVKMVVLFMICQIFFIRETTINAESDVKLSNPRVSSITRKTMYFGFYWQGDTSGDGEADRYDEKEPIKWQILDRKGDYVYLLSDKILDLQEFSSNSNSGLSTILGSEDSYENSKLRKWLNNYFLVNAFNDVERKALVSDKSKTDLDSKFSDVEDDLVFLPSLQDMTNERIGNDSDRYFESLSRKAQVTDFSCVKDYRNEKNHTEYGGYWLRDKGYDNSEFLAVSTAGYINFYGYDESIKLGVRPAICVDLSKLTSENYEFSDDIKLGVKEAKWDVVRFGKMYKEPVLWRVLEVDGDEVLLLSDKVYLRKSKKLFDYSYEDDQSSTINSRTEQFFLENIFNDTEKDALIEKEIVGLDYYSDEIINEKRKVYNPSIEEMTREEYGFPPLLLCSSRERETSYWRGDRYATWVLRNNCSSGMGLLNLCNMGEFVSLGSGVRPLINVSISKAGNMLEYIGEVDSLDTEVKHVFYPVSDDLDLEEKTAEGATPTPEASYVPVSTDSPQVENIQEVEPKENVNDSGRNTLQAKKNLKIPKISSQKIKKKYCLIKWKKLSKAKKYQVQYSWKKSFSKATLSTTKKTRFKIKAGKKKNKCYVKLRAIYSITGKSVYSKWSAKKTIKFR